MSHQRFTACCALAAASWMTLASSAGHVAAQEKPNIILLVSDDAGYADFGFMNEFTGRATEFKTPNLDALAAQSVRFSQAYATGSVCSTSRAGMLTGRYQQRFGMDYNTNPDFFSPINGVPTEETLIFEAMKSAGYSTGVFGKWHIGDHLTKEPQNQGVDEFFGIWEGGGPYFGPVQRPGQAVRRGFDLVDWVHEPSFNNIPNDPVLGRMITDAHGDEASKFVANHANKANPFFLYVPFTAPHSPYDEAKADDIAQFNGTSLTGLRKNVAALTYAMDRAVGNILARVNDPDGNAETNDSIAGNTIIVFANDNGGNFPWDPASMGQAVHSNGPLRGFKASFSEGGIRVPMMISAPGLAPGMFEKTVSSLDLFPTLTRAAGVAEQGNLDGVDLLPSLTGEQTGAVHDELFWRAGVNGFAVRKGDWKLVKIGRFSGVYLFHLDPSSPIADGAGEDVNLASSEPGIFRELLDDYVDWEVTLQKGQNTTVFSYLNRFDAFRFRTDGAAEANWRDFGAWLNDAAPGSGVTMAREDSYANAMLVFPPRNDASYSAKNNFSRASSLEPGFGGVGPAGLAEFMLNELQLSGEFDSDVDRSATLQGLPLMFTKSLAGAGPRIVLGATSVQATKFTYNVNMDIVLYDSLEIAGDSDQNFVLNGQLRDFRDPASVTKTGASIVTLSGNNTYTGETVVSGGTLRLDGEHAALAHTARVRVGAEGTLALASGRIRTPKLEIDDGGKFVFTSGILEAAQIEGDLTNQGGLFQPGLSTGIVNISGDFTQNSGGVEIEIGGLTPGSEFDQILADHATLSGGLVIDVVNSFSPAIGDEFEILKTTGGVSGVFDSIGSFTLLSGKRWEAQYLDNSVILRVVAAPVTTIDHLSADFDHNDITDVGDLSVWEAGLGEDAGGDADLDGVTDGRDFLVWQRESGLRIVPVSGAVVTAVPEPERTLQACIIGFAAICGEVSLERRAGGPRGRHYPA